MKTTGTDCQYEMIAAQDALELIQGKWRIPIVLSIVYGNKRFGEIRRAVSNISPKMLSQELKALEENKIITRQLYDTMPITVEYSLTPLGASMRQLLVELLNWGTCFRKALIDKNN
ncbi:winged helix-turn-helix transcriptional regulator [Chitinophaga silvisoli]|uniref:Transcriptional regulator n=1 Tax=Chitinophaga silvisoli TaxID=2291814 RepID=A0A3E1NY16_9BACT|nr:helix-turn-helix domain-containing protein [Chitinophaga silvisoli]RFM32819.1 transcriptional regulator [Chitinophaga silvisoli]